MAGFALWNYMAQVQEKESLKELTKRSLPTVSLMVHTRWLAVCKVLLNSMKRRRAIFLNSQKSPTAIFSRTRPRPCIFLPHAGRNQRGETKEIKDFIAVPMLYSQYKADEVETAVELFFEKKSLQQ